MCPIRTSGSTHSGTKVADGDTTIAQRGNVSESSKSRFRMPNPALLFDYTSDLCSGLASIKSTLISPKVEISLKSVKIDPILNDINKFEIAMACLFCEMTEDRIIDRNDLAYSIRDGFPVTRLHTLIIPKRHAVDYFDLTKEELLACDDLLKKILG